MWMQKIKYILIILIFSAWGVFAHHISKRFAADFKALAAQNLLESGEAEQALETIRETIKLNPTEPSYHLKKAKIYLSLLAVSSSDSSVVLKGRALDDVRRARDQNTKNLVTLRNSLPLYYFLAVADLAEPSSAANTDPEFLNTARKFFESMVREYPTDAGVLVSVAKYQRKLGLLEDYEKTKLMVEKLRPELLEWHEVFD
jgi:tetratricopeptide (TPR) repeat protein